MESLCSINDEGYIKQNTQQGVQIELCERFFFVLLNHNLLWESTLLIDTLTILWKSIFDKVISSKFRPYKLHI